MQLGIRHQEASGTTTRVHATFPSTSKRLAVIERVATTRPTPMTSTWAAAPTLAMRAPAIGRENPAAIASPSAAAGPSEAGLADSAASCVAELLELPRLHPAPPARTNTAANPTLRCIGRIAR
jgi:hypothetical protein